jgi:hypothetical protein
VLEANEFAAAARLWARVEIAGAEIRTLETLPLQQRARTIVAISKIDLECATTRLRSKPDNVELEDLGRWLEMVESHLRAVRHGLTAIGSSQSPKARIA